MILSDAGIRRALASGEIEIDPAPIQEDYSPSAVDICLGAAATFRRWKREALGAEGVAVHLDLTEQNYAITASHFAELIQPTPDGAIILPPYEKVPEVMLCQTNQRIHLRPESRLAARVEGRSSLARLGLMVHMTAPIIHAGFNGTITLEMVNHGPFFLKLVPLQTRICQFIFEQLDSDPEMKITTDFQHQTDPTGRS